MILQFDAENIDGPVVDALRQIAFILERIQDLPIFTGTSTPEGAVTAPIGSLFLRTDGGASTTLYVKESGTGSTGWVAK